MPPPASVDVVGVAVVASVGALSQKAGGIAFTEGALAVVVFATEDSVPGFGGNRGAGGWSGLRSNSGAGDGRAPFVGSIDACVIEGIVVGRDVEPLPHNGSEDIINSSSCLSTFSSNGECSSEFLELAEVRENNGAGAVSSGE